MKHYMIEKIEITEKEKQFIEEYKKLRIDILNSISIPMNLIWGYSEGTSVRQPYREALCLPRS